MKKVFLIFCVMMCGCTVYQKDPGFWSVNIFKAGGGYSDKTLDNGNIWLKYQGNGTQTYSDVKLFWDRRAEELCPHGYEILKIEKDVYINNSYGGAPGVTNKYEWPAWVGEIVCS